MSTDPETAGPRPAGNRAILRLWAAGREVRTIAASPAPTPTLAAAAAAAIDAEKLDAAAGCEFVDDLIRLRD
jgi:hypothetical protein